MPRPDTFWRLHIRFSDSGDEVEGELLVIFAAVHWFVKFWNRRYQLGACRNPERGGPMLIHSMKEIHEPLAGDVVAYEDEGEGKCLDHDRDNKIHVRVSVNTSALIALAVAL
jgi:hypothetical protein